MLSINHFSIQTFSTRCSLWDNSKERLWMKGLWSLLTHDGSDLVPLPTKSQVKISKQCADFVTRTLDYSCIILLFSCSKSNLGLETLRRGFHSIDKSDEKQWFHSMHCGGQYQRLQKHNTTFDCEAWRLFKKDVV